MRSTFIAICFCMFSILAMSQNVSINESGANPDASAILDISSQTKGLLIPRMNSLERINIPLPKTGLLVYDIDLQSLFYFDGGQWVEFASSRKGLRDSDFDTKVMVEQGMDDDTVRLISKGVQKLKVTDQGVVYESANKNMFLGSGGGEVGAHNLYIGHAAGSSTILGDSNIFIGNYAGQEFTTDWNGNTLIGSQSGIGQLRGNYNVHLGYLATGPTQGNENVSIGYQAGNMGVGTGHENISIGKSAGHKSGGSAHRNIAIGTNAGNPQSSGDNSIYIGRNAGSSEVSCDSCIFIGSNAGLNNGNALHDLLIIDNEVTSTPLIIGRFDTDLIGFYGKVSINTNVPQSELHVNHANDAADAGFMIQNTNNNNYWRLYTRSSNGNLRFYSSEGESNSCGNNGGADDYVAWVSSCSGAWNSTSDLRKKKDFSDLKDVLPILSNLRVLNYHFLSEGDHDEKHIGLIAQEVQPYFPELVNYNAELDLYTMNYDGFGPIAIKGIQELHVENEQLKIRLSDQAEDIDQLKRELMELKQLIIKMR